MASNMFHQGDLNSGITRAIQERKVVACFIRKDDDEISQLWEEQWLAQGTQPTDVISEDGPPLGLVVSLSAVLLKIEHGSKESGFLNAFCPITKVPTLAIIKDGQVLDKIEAGVSQDEFVARTLRAVGLQPEGSAGGEMSGRARTAVDAPPEEELVDDIGGRHVIPRAEPSGSRTEPPSASSAPVPSSSQSTTQRQDQSMQTMLQERKQKLEAERQKQEAAEKKRRAEANARRKEAEAAQAEKDRQRTTTDTSEKQKARDAWIYQQKQRKDEAKKERERILERIEADKKDRKARAQLEKENQSSGGAAYSEMAMSSTQVSPGGKSHTSCALQIRLFDGSSIRGKFAPDADIAAAVRTWVKEASPAGGADIPYTFRQILAPKPSRTIEVSEEHQSLFDLGLVPNATLVLVPVEGYTDAYSGAGGGYIGSAWNAASYVGNTVYGIFGTALSYVPGFGGAVPTEPPYMGGTGDEHERSNVEGARMADSDSAYAATSSSGTAKMRVKTLADQRADEEEAKKRQAAEFYNGNSSAFQGRRDDEDK